MYRRGGSKKDHHNKPTKEESDSSKYAELLVFGYACKLFRDDERAHFHEQGKHLIPWMGDKSIMIDRYDGRGHLHDLSEYDADSWNRDYQLSEEEARIEALCDEERYLALHTDLLEEEARQEEEYKRLSEALADEGTFNAVGYRYSADYYDPSQPTEEEEANKDTDADTQEESEEPFVAPPGLIIPPDVELPATIKTHAIIERTANFVCKQGAQFEIVLKAKQARNSQFDFLRFDHYLNPYYKHILRAMKEGRYTPISDNQQAQQQDTHSEDSDDDGDGNYLHPSLMAPKKCSRLEELMKPLRVIDPDHPLAALVRKAKQEKNGSAAVPAPPPAPEEGPQPSVPTQTEYSADPNVAAMYYGYCLLPDGTYCLAPPPPGIDASAYYGTMPHGMIPTQASAMPPPPGTTPPPEQVPLAPVSISAPIPVSVSVAAPSPASYTAPSPASYTAPAVSTVTSVQHQAPVTPVAPAVATPPPAVATPPPTIIPPPPDIQPVIDKLAEYVARNGEKFEASVRAKNDPRFDFLQTWNQYYTYYEFKKHYFMQKEGRSLPESGPKAESTDDSSNGSSDKTPNEGLLIKASFAPISFAIKAKENDMLPLEKNRVRLDDDSDEERAAEAELEGGAAGAAGAAGSAAAGGVATAAQVVREAPAAPPPEEKKPTLTLEELEAKQAKQKLEARLAAAAREKLAQASKESKEKQLQAERKRKAALFLQTLRGPDTDTKRPEEPPAPPEPEVIPAMAAAIILPAMSRVPILPVEYQSGEVPPLKTSEVPASAFSPLPTSVVASASSSTASASASRAPERVRERERDRDRGRERDKEKKKKKHHKRRSRSRSRSKSKTKSKRGLPSAYRRLRRSRSQSRSPGRRERRTRSPEWRREERERERHGAGTYRLGTSPSLGRKRSRSRTPHEKRKKKSSQRAKGSSRSPSASPARTEEKKRLSTLSASPSPATSPTSRDGSQEKDKQVASAIVSSVQSKITQDLMAKVRAMLAASKTLPSNPS